MRKEYLEEICTWGVQENVFDKRACTLRDPRHQPLATKNVARRLPLGEEIITNIQISKLPKEDLQKRRKKGRERAAYNVVPPADINKRLQEKMCEGLDNVVWSHHGPHAASHGRRAARGAQRRATVAIGADILDRRTGMRR